ncbi:hypothetical protein A2U01_0115403, partial [Trifolium medium]|nr:hypothetical protein [Trifolium medium]
MSKSSPSNRDIRDFVMAHSGELKAEEDEIGEEIRQV